jgi:hypothetical protein
MKKWNQLWVSKTTGISVYFLFNMFGCHLHLPAGTGKLLSTEDLHGAMV